VLVALIVGLAVFGLVIGSFLNVVIYRVPRGLSIVGPGSFCPNCHQPVAPRDNVPLVSYFVLRGRCRSCGIRISRRYVVVEVVTGALFAATAAKFRFSLALPAYEVLAAGLIALGAIDLELRVLPRRIVAVVGGGVLALLLAASAEDGSWHRFVVASASAAGWFLLYAFLHRIDSRLLGFGDVRLVAVLGFALGWLGFGYVIAGFLIANLIGAVVGLALIASGRATRKTQVPFGPFLVSGCEVAIFAGSFLLSPFHGL
jgi:leader peptidase (prepilin peptidase) / N-methyltransferase